MRRETVIDVLLRETGFPESPSLGEATRLLAQSGGSTKALRDLLGLPRRRAEARARVFRAPPTAPMRLEARPGGYIVDAAAEEVESARWQAHQRSLAAQHEAARQERSPRRQPRVSTTRHDASKRGARRRPAFRCDGPAIDAHDVLARGGARSILVPIRLDPDLGASRLAYARSRRLGQARL